MIRAAMLLVSLAAHALAAWGLAGAPPVTRRAVPVEIEIAARPPELPRAEPPPPPRPSTTAPVRRGRRARPMVATAGTPNAEPVVVPEAMPEPSDPAAPLDLTETPVALAPSARAAPEEAVDRSRPPEPPSLDDVLAHQAAGVGRAGDAVVRVLIGADGRARVLRVISASALPLGEACRATVQGSRWRAALDRNGRPVPREVSYRCAFELGG